MIFNVISVDIFGVNVVAEQK